MKNFLNFVKQNYIKHTNLYQNLLIIISYLVLPYIFFINIFDINNILLAYGDAISYTVPFREFMADNISNFNFPLWNPLSVNGFPFLDEIQAGVFYPINIIFSFLKPFILSYNISILLHFSLIGIFTYFFVREYNFLKFSSFIAGLCFMFSGFLTVRLCHPQMIFVVTWMPLILMFLEKYIKTNNYKFIILASIFFSFHFFAGNPQIFVYATFIEIFYFVFIFLRDKKLGIVNFKIFFAGFLLFLTLDIMFISIQLMPTYELMKLGFRTRIDYNSFSSLSFDLKNFFMLFFPYIFGQFNSSNYQDVINIFRGDYIGTSIYLGTFSFFIALFGINLKNKNKWFWITLLVLSFLLILGDNTPLYKIMYIIPIYNKFRVPTRNFMEICSSIAILCGFGTEYLLRSDFENYKKRYFSMLFLISSLLTGFFVFYYYFKKIALSNNEYFFGYNISEISSSLSTKKSSVLIPLTLIILTLLFFTISLFLKKLGIFNKKIFLAIIPFLIFLDLFYFGYNFGSYLKRDTKPLFEKSYYSDTYKYLSNDKNVFRIYPLFYNLIPYDSNDEIKDIAGNMNMIYDLDSISGYQTFYLRDLERITSINWIGDIENNQKDLISNGIVLDMANVKYIIVPKELIQNKGISEYYKKINLKIRKHLINDEFLAKNIKNNNFTINNYVDKYISFSNLNTSLKILEIPVDLESNSIYKINIKIMENERMEYNKSESLDNNIYIDFYGVRNGKPIYDNSEQDIIIYPESIGNIWQEYEFYINSGKIPEQTMTYFRIFSWTDRDILLKDIALNEVLGEGFLGYKIVEEVKDSLLIENMDYMPRLYFAQNIIKVNDINEVENALWNNKYNLKNFTFVENYDLENIQYNNLYNELKIISYQNNYIDIIANCPEDAFLVFSDTYYPGWKAYVDGNIEKIYKVNGIYKGIHINKGEHYVRFKYLPNTLIIGAIITSISFTFAFVILLLPIKAKKKIKS